MWMVGFLVGGDNLIGSNNIRMTSNEGGEVIYEEKYYEACI